MVAAAVAATVDSNRLRGIDGIGFGTSRREPSLSNTIRVVTKAIDQLPEPPRGPVIAERGEFYDEPAWTITSSLAPDLEFKYVESIAERRTVEAAHHAAYAARSLILTPHHA